MKRIIILTSSKTCELTFAVIEGIKDDCLISCVICDNVNVYNNLETKMKSLVCFNCINKKILNKDEVNRRLLIYLNLIKPDYVVLAGYMNKLSKEITDNYKCINIHPSILPKYPGLNTYKRVLESDDEYHGFTIHYCNEEYDQGKIIFQFSEKIENITDRNNENAENLLKDYVKKQERFYYPIILNNIFKGWL